MKKELRQLRDLVAVVAIIAALLTYFRYGPPRFWGDFTGMTEADVMASLGKPRLDSRTDPLSGDPQHYELCWYATHMTLLYLDFEEGIVVSQKRGRR